MSLLPFVLGANPPMHRIVDQDFGVGLTPEDLLSAVVAPMIARDYYRPWRHMAMAARDYGSTITSTKDKFQVNLDVQHFSPEEIIVKTVDGYVIIEGKHEEKKDEHGSIARQFTRRYTLPENCDPATVVSTLSSDGVLTITAPKTTPSSKNERIISITKTGPVKKLIKHAVGEPATEEGADANGDGK